MAKILPSVGIDVVDLRELSETQHPRYSQRVLSDFEVTRVGSDNLLLWQHWAAKEAAYKALKRHEPELLFLPVNFEFDAAQGVVRHGSSVLECRVSVTTEFVHAVAATSKELCEQALEGTKILRVDPHEGRDISTFLRKEVTTSAARLFGFDTARINVTTRELQNSYVGNSKYAVPEILIDGVACGHLLSLSHDGSFAAFVLVKGSTAL